jgi:hypothetical protein
MDMFEPQDHPDDIAYPGATPTPPYDSAGYTLAFQMGVKFDRILDGFDGPFHQAHRAGQAAGRRHQVAAAPRRCRLRHEELRHARVGAGRLVVLG